MKNNINILTYFLTNSLFLGGGLSIIFKYSKHDTWISIILGTLLGIILLYIIHKYIINKKLNTILKIFYLIYIISITIIILVSISTFISSYYLTKTPALISCIPLILLAVYSSKNTNKISYIALPLFIISISIVIFKSLILITDIDINNIYPILNTNIYDLFKASFIYGLLSTTPSILLINEKTNYKESLKYYLISSLFILVTSFILIASLGNLITILSYPEYSILRKIRLLKFIENIEGVLAITWIFDIFITLSIISNKIKQIFNNYYNYISYFIILIIMYIIYILINDNYFSLILIYKYHILWIISMTLLIYSQINNTKKTSNS